MATNVKVPTLGESITEGTLAEWLKQPGDPVKQDEPIASLETDKVSVEVPSPVAGVLTRQLVKAGDTVAVGADIAVIDAGDAAAGCGDARGSAWRDSGRGSGREHHQPPGRRRESRASSRHRQSAARSRSARFTSGCSARFTPGCSVRAGG